MSTLDMFGSADTNKGSGLFFLVNPPLTKVINFGWAWSKLRERRRRRTLRVINAPCKVRINNRAVYVSIRSQRGVALIGGK